MFCCENRGNCHLSLAQRKFCFKENWNFRNRSWINLDYKMENSSKTDKRRMRKFSPVNFELFCFIFTENCSKSSLTISVSIIAMIFRQQKVKMLKIPLFSCQGENEKSHTLSTSQTDGELNFAYTPHHCFKLWTAIVLSTLDVSSWWHERSFHIIRRVP